jgi:hypothetical protein
MAVCGGIFQIGIIMNSQILKNDHLEIQYLVDPLRIIGLTPSGKSNLLADLIDLPAVPTPFGDYHFRGGHRLWHAPEALPRTYIPDTPVSITALPDGVRLKAQTEPGTGIRKQIEIHLSSSEPSVTLIHSLTNEGLWSVELAPWAITQLRLGGTVIMPMPVGNADPAGLLHNRQFSLWPYARLHDPRLELGDEYILFRAEALLPPFKIGYFNPSGWLAYWLDGILFRKTFEARKNSSYPDNNCNAEMYCNDQFVELESLGPVTRLEPGASVMHVEKWDILREVAFLPEGVKEKLA